MISTSKLHVKHLFAGQNTQHRESASALLTPLVDTPKLNTCLSQEKLYSGKVGKLKLKSLILKIKTKLFTLDVL